MAFSEHMNFTNEGLNSSLSWFTKKCCKYFELILGIISIDRHLDFTIIWHLLRKWLTGYAFWLKGNESLSGNPNQTMCAVLRASADVSDSKLVAPYYWVALTLCTSRDICSKSSHIFLDSTSLWKVRKWGIHHCFKHKQKKSKAESPVRACTFVKHFPWS